MTASSNLILVLLYSYILAATLGAKILCSQWFQLRIKAGIVGALSDFKHPQASARWDGVSEMIYSFSMLSSLKMHWFFKFW